MRHLRYAYLLPVIFCWFATACSQAKATKRPTTKQAFAESFVKAYEEGDLQAIYALSDLENAHPDFREQAKIIASGAGECSLLSTAWLPFEPDPETAKRAEELGICPTIKPLFAFRIDTVNHTSGLKLSITYPVGLDPNGGFAFCCTRYKGTPPKPGELNYLVLNHSSYRHDIEVSLNGAPYASMTEEGSAMSPRRNPLTEGTHCIAVRLIPRQNATGNSDGKINIYLSPTMWPEKDASPVVEVSANGYCEASVTVVMVDGRPQSFKQVVKEWKTAKKAIKIYEETVGQDGSGATKRAQYRKWTDAGVPFDESLYVNDTLQHALNYRPDGTIGSRVTDGKGALKTWYASSALKSELPVVNGRVNGVGKEYAEDGTVDRMSIYKDGKWVEDR